MVSNAKKTNAKIIQSFHNLVPSPKAAKLTVNPELPDDNKEKLVKEASAICLLSSFSS